MKDFFSRSRQKGSASFAFFVVLFFAATALFFIIVLSQSGNKPLNRKDPGLHSPAAKFEKLESELSHFYIAMDEAEAMRSGSKYLGVVSEAENTIMQADALLEEAAKAQKGIVDGMMGGLSENYESRFTQADKFRMLSEKYHLPPEKIQKIKADVELMFLEELMAKYAPVVSEESSAEEPSHEK